MRIHYYTWPRRFSNDFSVHGHSTVGGLRNCLDKSLQSVDLPWLSIRALLRAPLDFKPVNERTGFTRRAQRTSSRFAAHDNRTLIAAWTRSRSIGSWRAWSAAAQLAMKRLSRSGRRASFDQFILSVIMLLHLVERASSGRSRLSAAGRDCLNTSCRADVRNWLRHLRGEQPTDSRTRYRELGFTVVATNGRQWNRC